MGEVVKADLDGLARAAQAVAEGGLICYPTDTVYGLGCDPLNSSAVKRTMQAKGPRTKPMPILVTGLKTAESLAFVNERARKLAKAFWPGPLTLVLRARGALSVNLTSGGNVGVRAPNHSLCLELLKLCSGALVGTSANVTGKPPARTAEEAYRQVGNHVDLILDGGSVPLGVASTVVDLTQQNLVVFREGPLDRGRLLRALRREPQSY